MTDIILKEIEQSLKQLDNNVKEIEDLCTTTLEQLEELRERLNDTDKDLPLEDIYDVHNSDFI